MFIVVMISNLHSLVFIFSLIFLDIFFFWFLSIHYLFFFFFQAEDGIRDYKVTGVQTCALPISYGALENNCTGPGWRRSHQLELVEFRVVAEDPIGGSNRHPAIALRIPSKPQIGRASCRERV